MDSLREALESLPQEFKKALEMYFGINQPRASYEYIGDKLGVTTKRAKLLVAKGLRLMRHPDRSKHLKKYMRRPHGI